MKGEKTGKTDFKKLSEKNCWYWSGNVHEGIQLFQLRLSRSKAEKLNTSAKGCWEILKN
jgi:hypothetical protein